MVTVNHSDWANTCCYRFRCLSVPLLISETEGELARPSLESFLYALNSWVPCNAISIFLTFWISGSKETIALLVFVEQPQWCFWTLLNFPSICSFLKKALASPSPFIECQVWKVHFFLSSIGSRCSSAWSFDLSLWTHPPGLRALIVSGFLKACDFI